MAVNGQQVDNAISVKIGEDESSVNITVWLRNNRRLEGAITISKVNTDPLPVAVYTGHNQVQISIIVDIGAQYAN